MLGGRFPSTSHLSPASSVPIARQVDSQPALEGEARPDLALGLVVKCRNLRRPAASRVAPRVAPGGQSPTAMPPTRVLWEVPLRKAVVLLPIYYRMAADGPPAKHPKWAYQRGDRCRPAVPLSVIAISTCVPGLVGGKRAFSSQSCPSFRGEAGLLPNPVDPVVQPLLGTTRSTSTGSHRLPSPTRAFVPTWPRLGSMVMFAFALLVSSGSPGEKTSNPLSLANQD